MHPNNTSPGNFLSRRVSAAMLLCGLLVPVLSASAAERPNVLIIMADDCTYNDLPLYGGQNAKTPHIDHLATQGLTFNRAYLAEAMCQPCRAELYTGQYPMTNGCAWNHSASRPSVTSMPHHLRAVGYRVGLAGKVHVKPSGAFPFEMVEGFDPSCTRNPTRPHQLAGAREFLARSASEPFCLVIALTEPHVPWVMGDASQYPPAKIKLPSNLADTPRMRQDYAAYLAEVTYMDSQVGDILSLLEETNLAEETLVLFTSEQGAQLPGCKWTNWDTGVHTALIARWPGQIAAGKRTDALVQYADVLPTLLELAGGDPTAERFDGRSFLPVLLGESGEHRKLVFAIHNHLPEGPPYPVRSVTDGTYRYIQNLLPERMYIEKHMMGLTGGGGVINPYWPSWMFATADDPRTYRLVERYQKRPAEELYHTAEDPFELDNRAGDARLREIQSHLKAALAEHMEKQGDPGAAVDTPQALEAARKGKHLYGPK